MNTINFTARIAINREFEKGKPIKQTKKEMIDYYDGKIAKIQKQKEQSLIINDFMHSKEAKTMLKHLPQEDIISICTPKEETDELMLQYTDSTVFDRLTYSQYEDWQGQEMNIFFPFKKDGSFDKNGLLKWLSKLTKFFNKTNAENNQ